jgi:uncharacterized protein
MKLENNFTIDVPIDTAWEALNNPETVAPCFPGATLTSYEGDSFAGTVKVKLGPIAMTYKGKGTYVSRDDDAHEVVIEANGRDSRGNGTANATVTASMVAEAADRTAVSMITDMTITGKPAQFGRGVISDVADKIIGQFAACVARKLAPAAEEAAPVAVSATAASEATSDIPTAPAHPARRATAPAGGSEATSDSVLERVSSTNGAAAPGTSEVEAPAADMTPAAAKDAPVTPVAGTSEVEAPAADMTPAAATDAPVTSGAGTSEAEAPAATAMAPDPATTTPASTARSAATAGGTGLRAHVRSEVDAIDLLDHAGVPVLQRLVPVVGGGLLLLLVVLLIRRLRAG